MPPVLSLVILGPRRSISPARVPGLSRSFCQKQPREGPQARRQEMSHVGQPRDISTPHPTVDCPCLMPSPRLGMHITPSWGCIHPPWLPGWAGWKLAEQTQRVGDAWRG